LYRWCDGGTGFQPGKISNTLVLGWRALNGQLFGV
jgi:hypothetical protein